MEVSFALLPDFSPCMLVTVTTDAIVVLATKLTVECIVVVKKQNGQMDKRKGQRSARKIT